jgi:ribonuclease HI
MSVVIYTDGACKGNPGVGGWGAILIFGENVKKIYGGEKDTTNNRMELLGAINALSVLKSPCHVELYTDSKYVKNGIESWLHRWKNNNWMTSAKKPVKNMELWKELDRLSSRHQVRWSWVKGHSGDKYNEMADELANLGVKSVV